MSDTQTIGRELDLAAAALQAEYLLPDPRNVNALDECFTDVAAKLEAAQLHLPSVTDEAERNQLLAFIRQANAERHAIWDDID